MLVLPLKCRVELSISVNPTETRSIWSRRGDYVNMPLWDESDETSWLGLNWAALGLKRPHTETAQAKSSRRLSERNKLDKSALHGITARGKLLCKSYLFICVSLRHCWHWDILNTHWMMWLNKSTVCLVEFANLGCLFVRRFILTADGRQEGDQKFCVLGSISQQMFQEGSRTVTNLFHDWRCGSLIWIWWVFELCRGPWGPPPPFFWKWSMRLISPYVKANK